MFEWSQVAKRRAPAAADGAAGRADVGDVRRAHWAVAARPRAHFFGAVHCTPAVPADATRVLRAWFGTGL